MSGMSTVIKYGGGMSQKVIHGEGGCQACLQLLLIMEGGCLRRLLMLRVDVRHVYYTHSYANYGERGCHKKLCGVSVGGGP